MVKILPQTVSIFVLFVGGIILNKICLGTAQIGQYYGVNNALGRKPNYEESFQILTSAINCGINFFDTAGVYGDAENILGKFNISNFSVNVVSKLKGNLPNDADAVLNEIKTSLKNLVLKSLNGYLLHDAKDFYRSEILNGLKLAKENGLTKNIGVSIYEPEDALNVVKDKNIDYIQIPYNVLDQRLDKTNFFELAEKNNVKVFARSVFLQGLLLFYPNNLPNHLIKAKPYIEKFQSIAARYNFTPAEAAFLYSYCHSKIDYILFGVETVQQLENNIATVAKADNFKDCYAELHGTFENVDREIIIPSLWKV